MAEAQELRRTETGYQRTVTSVADRRVVVRRGPGPLREDRLTWSPEAGHGVAAREVAGVRWSLPHAPDPEGGWAYDVPGEASAATLLLAGMPVTGVTRMVAPLGAALRAVHDLAPGDLPAPAGWRRLARWLESGRGPGCAGRLHESVLRAEPLQRRARQLLGDLAATERVLALGAPGTNTVYPAPDGDHVVVLVTDEVAAAPAAWDLGWVLGEFLELANDPGVVTTPRSLVGHPLAEAVLARYGAGVDRGLVSRAAVLRWLVHLHDFAAYVGWADDLDARVHRVAELAADPDGVLGA